MRRAAERGGYRPPKVTRLCTAFEQAFGISACNPDGNAPRTGSCMGGNNAASGNCSDGMDARSGVCGPHGTNAKPLACVDGNSAK